MPVSNKIMPASQGQLIYTNTLTISGILIEKKLLQLDTSQLHNGHKRVPNY